MKKVLLVAWLSSTLLAQAQTINFDDLKRPGKSPEKSWTLGGVSTEAQGYIGQFGETDKARIAQNRRSSGGGGSPVPYVMVNAEMVCGFCTIVTRKLTLSGGPGTWSPSASSGAIHKGYNGLSGRYNYFVEFSQNKSCSGSVNVSGMRQTLSIRVYDDCKDAGTSEY